MKGVFATAISKQSPLNQVQHRRKRRNASPRPQDVSKVTQLLREGQFDKCKKKARKLVAHWPKHTLGWIVLGFCCNATGDYITAEKTLHKALHLDPINPEIHNTLGSAMRAQGKLHEAEQCFAQALSLKPDYVEARCNLAQTLWDMDQLQAAHKQYELVLKEKPEYAMARLALGHVLKELGAFEAARSNYHQLLTSADCWSAARFQLASLKKFQPNDEDLTSILDLLKRDDLKVDDQIHLHFAAGKALNDIGQDSDAAFAHYHAGNQLKSAQIKYHIEQEEENLATIRWQFSIGSRPIEAKGRIEIPRPVFIVGMPRSGTTLVEQILASHSAVAAGGERKDFERAVKSFDVTQSRQFPNWVNGLKPKDVQFISDEYWRSHFAESQGVQCFTDKMLSNFKMVGLIKQVIPDARIIHVQRNPIDTCLSCYFQLFAEGSLFSYDLSSLGRYHRALEQLMTFWKETLPSEELLTVEYEEIVQNPEPTIRRLLGFLGLDWEESCIEFHRTRRPVRTASGTQVRQPLYASSVERWNAYESHLQPLIDSLAGGNG